MSIRFSHWLIVFFFLGGYVGTVEYLYAIHGFFGERRTVNPQQTWMVWYPDGSGGAFSDAHATTVELLLCLGTVWKRHEAIMKKYTKILVRWSFSYCFNLRWGTFGYQIEASINFGTPTSFLPQPLRDVPPTSLVSSPSPAWTEFRAWVPNESSTEFVKRQKISVT